MQPRQPQPVVSPYLEGNFAPIREESDFELKVAGEFPREMNGAFYRIGANPQFHPHDAYHWFTGDGMIHAFFADAGKVRYRNRYVRTPKWLLENAHGRSLFGIMGNPVTSDPVTRGVDNGVANTNIIWHGGKLLALEEQHQPFEIDPQTLESRGYLQRHAGPITVHPKIDPANGELVWFTYATSGPLSGTMTYGVTDRDGTVLRRENFQAPYPNMTHDFFVTPRHVVFPMFPLTGSLQRVLSGGPPFAWEPDKGVRVGVMARDASVQTMRWFTADICFMFHPMNAWEDGDKIYADVMEHPASPEFPLPDRTMIPYEGARLVRWTIDLSGNTDTIKREPLDDMPGEFPRIDERRTGSAYRHGWFAANSRQRRGEFRFNSIVHMDLAARRRNIYEFGPNDVPGEPVFVPRSAAEGDGWIVTNVYRGESNTSDFVVFDALDIAAGPIGLATVPRRVPFSFHGSWKNA